MDLYATLIVIPVLVFGAFTLLREAGYHFDLRRASHRPDQSFLRFAGRRSADRLGVVTQ